MKVAYFSNFLRNNFVIRYHSSKCDKPVQCEIVFRTQVGYAQFVWKGRCMISKTMEFLHNIILKICRRNCVIEQHSSNVIAPPSSTTPLRIFLREASAACTVAKQCTLYSVLSLRRNPGEPHFPHPCRSIWAVARRTTPAGRTWTSTASGPRPLTARPTVPRSLSGWTTPAHNVGGMRSTPRFPTKHWEILKIHDFSLIFHEIIWKMENHGFSQHRDHGR